MLSTLTPSLVFPYPPLPTALGYHGLIGIFVLARKKDVDANHFVLHEAKIGSVARGRNLGVALAANKGACGLAFRYFDVTFAVMNCHFASDQKGVSRLAKRNLDSRLVIHETNLWREEVRTKLGQWKFKLPRSVFATTHMTLCQYSHPTHST